MAPSHYWLVIDDDQKRRGLLCGDYNYKCYRVSICQDYKPLLNTNHTVSLKGFKQKVITQANDYHRVKGENLKAQNCNELKSPILGFLRLLRLLWWNDLKTQNDKNFKWRLVKTRWNLKFGLSNLENDHLTSMTLKGISDFFQKYIFRISALSWEKWAVARLSSQAFTNTSF